MGTWGTAISSNDEFCEVYEDFFYLYNKGYELSEIKERLIKEYNETLELREVEKEFWFALAKAQWECKALEAAVFDKVKNYVTSGKDIEIWRELGATEKSIKSRQKALEQFLLKLSTERETAKKRKPIKFHPAPFKKGDCIVFKMSNNNYGGAIVLEIFEDEIRGFCYTAHTTINIPQKPTLQNFSDTYIPSKLRTRYEATCGYKNTLEDRNNVMETPEICWCFPDEFKKHSTNFEVIGNIDINKDYSDPETRMPSHWECFIEYTENILRNINGNYKFELFRLKDFL